MSIKRSSGILLPISSLPSNYGIGTFGKAAYDFVDFLLKANQTYWQILPLNPTGYGDSPYQAFCTYAGNPYFIDLDILCDEKLLDKKDLNKLKVKNLSKVDYAYLYKTRFNILYKAYLNGIKKYKKSFNSFIQENINWIEDYALFMSLKKHFDMKSWLDWPDIGIKSRHPEAMDKYKELLKDDINFYSFIQFLFFRQYEKLKKYANSKGIKIIGDLPIYVALDSSDVWANIEEFKIDTDTIVPKEVAGVPPDYFSKDGQLWGNPLYNWDYMALNGYKWWIERIDGARKLYDVIRIDHFRGLHEYWSVPYGDKTARNGKWNKGPGIHFVTVLKEWFYDTQFIAEDLGIIDENVTKLLMDSGFPGMRVLQFGMSPDGTSYHMPHNHIENCVCYTSTHDNYPMMGWFKHAKKKDLNYAIKYYGLNELEGYNYGFIRAGMSSVASLFIAQIQDYLGLDEKATINNPGTLGNWKWRLTPRQLDDKLAKKIAYITKINNRSRVK